MKRLHVFNLIGVFVLCGLCVVQWRTNRVTNLELNQAIHRRLKLETQIAEEKQKSAGLSADLDGFRRHVTQTESQMKELQQKLATVNEQVQTLITARDRLQDGIAQWKAAVTARDEKIQQLANERNDITTKFNELVEKYNATVKDLNERTGQYNDLAAKYNEIAKKK